MTNYNLTYSMGGPNTLDRQIPLLESSSLRAVGSLGAQVAVKMKATFTRYGIAEEAVCDNGPQFSSTEFRELAHELDFKHITSSPHHSQGNGHTERARQTAKGI